uniref:Uncharacterized protein n=1 Tax=Arundo donax TaxID=35708 RepID=A0A0A9AFL0_ARUDO
MPFCIPKPQFPKIDRKMNHDHYTSL